MSVVAARRIRHARERLRGGKAQMGGILASHSACWWWLLESGNFNLRALKQPSSRSKTTFVSGHAKSRQKRA
jgi:hypothetical protein